MRTRRSPAKLNLALRVGQRQATGYHELETLMIPISWYDHLSVTTVQDSTLGPPCPGSASPGFPDDSRPTPADSATATRVTLTVEHTCTLADDLSSGQEADLVAVVPSDHSNLVVRIAAGFLQHCGIRAAVHFHLHKNIPAGAGLGGASSNAATALLLLNEQFQVGWSWQALAEFSSNYGSDIAFFLQPRAAICRGRGEQVTPISLPNRHWFVVVRPPFALGTPQVFAELARQRRLAGPDRPGHELEARTQQNAELIKTWSGGFLQKFEGRCNDLEAPATFLKPELEGIRATVSRSFPQFEQMSGSGSCWFAGFRHRRQAIWAKNRYRAARIGRAEVVKPIAT